MREVKFRAWNKKRKEMIYDALEIKNIGLGDGSVVVDSKTQTDDELDWLQYTGLKSKSGQEIYEGDLVKFKYSYRNTIKYLKRVVFYDTTFARFSTAQENDEDGEYLDESADMEIIGNVYEDSELMKKGGD